MTGQQEWKPSPPPGWPYVVLPAEPVLGPHASEQKDERRRLADNVVCMFAHERAPVANIKWRGGRYPRTVARLWTGNRLYPGAYCVLWHPKDERNHGCVVELVERDRRRVDLWHVRAVSRPIHVHWINEPNNPEGQSESWSALTSAKSLRRAPRPYSHEREGQ